MNAEDVGALGIDSFSCRLCTLIRKLRPPRKSFPPVTTQARNPPRWISEESARKPFDQGDWQKASVYGRSAQESV